MNQNEKIELIKSMQNDSGMEMSTDDLEKLLEEELGRPESEMDAELIAELLELLEEDRLEDQSDAQTEAQADAQVRVSEAASWKRLEKKLKARQAKAAVQSAGKWLFRAAAVVVALAALSYGMFSTAQAFNWEFLLKLFEPVAETFHLYSNNQETEKVPTAPTEQDVYTDADNGYQAVTYATADEFPDVYHGYAVKPEGLPERFTYLQGSSFEDSNMATITVVYSEANGKCILSMTRFSNANTIVGIDLEKTKDQNSEKYVAGYPVTFYYNQDHATLSASWVNEDAHFTVTGTLTEAEMIRVIEQLCVGTGARQ